MQAAYMQSPHLCDIYNAIMFNKYPKHKRAIEKLHQVMLSQYVIQGGLLYIYMKNNFGEQEPVLCVPPSRLTYFWTSITLRCWEDTQELPNVTKHLGKEYTVPIYPIMLDCT